MAAPARSGSRRDSLVLAACVALALVARVVPEPMKEPAATSLRRTVVAPLVALQRDAELSRKAFLEREEIARVRDSVALDGMMDAAIRRENEQLRRTVGLGARLRWGFVPAEILHGQSIGEEYTVTLSAGSRAGARPYSPVVAADGIVGMVKTVDPGMSIAILWSHPDFRVSAMAADGSAFGIVAARLASPGPRNLLELRGVPMRSTLKPGTMIWSSGMGGVFPRGIPLGTVIAEDKQPMEVWARTYILKPAVNPADVDAVMILRPERQQGGLQGIWASPASVDSAVRRIVAAGDSAARQAAADSARRAAAADSTSRAATPAPPPAPDSGTARRTPPAPAAARRDTIRRDTTTRRAAPRDTTRSTP
ncbi:MAG TPA: rod shape-determining protein MreC [Gemmatimonadaceae bacterium]|nr:rod shape-determining protein MreC [Gemmatimonadaceae bacterium]